MSSISKRESQHASPPAKRACRGVTKAGQPCRSTSIGPDGYCAAHGGKLDLAAAGRQGGKARGKKAERAGDKLEGLAHAAIEELLTNAGGSATARAAAARLVLDKVAGSTTGAVELAKRALWAEQQAAREQELSLARERLTRLVEREVQERFEALTQEQLEELVERRATEKAVELYAARMLAETEAVKAELRVDAPEVATPPAGQVDLQQMIAEDERRQAEERIAREWGKQ
jgi:hypothetical protein